MLPCKCDGILHHISRRVSEHQRTEGLLERIGGLMLSLQALRWYVIRFKFLVQRLFEDSYRFQLRQRFGAADL